MELVDLLELRWAWGLLGQDPRRFERSTIKLMEQVTLVTLMVRVLPVARLGR
ncbi:hypothetical protein STRTUCAR8_05891 [Streptomyces turgidiscabies Car8]|uniref:Uncharacterized protein n=1 Tax=Streptomyces turgidiscabies (strain Car8) TaxID=698760 RepID=L7FAD4_STRT8|nr:hypothetical protein STRTUCAR8_05891 [Streptomyces turgidiscabies Car8]